GMTCASRGPHPLSHATATSPRIVLFIIFPSRSRSSPESRIPNPESCLDPQPRLLDVLLDPMLPRPDLAVALEVDQGHVDLVVNHPPPAFAILDRLDLALEHVVRA